MIFLFFVLFTVVITYCKWCHISFLPVRNGLSGTHRQVMAMCFTLRTFRHYDANIRIHLIARHKNVIKSQSPLSP